MKLYFTNRELAAGLEVGLARWKRWSREFLPPDPLGGLQSGYARQYSIDQAFTVYLGGHLVAELKFGIAAARQIVADLHPWFSEAGVRFNTPPAPLYETGPFAGALSLHVAIAAEDTALGGPPAFRYTVTGLIAEQHRRVDGCRLKTVQVVETPLTPAGDAPALTEPRTLPVTGLLGQFVRRLDLDPRHFGALNAAAAG
jgi:hypothetical protein